MKPILIAGSVFLINSVLIVLVLVALGVEGFWPGFLAGIPNGVFCASLYEYLKRD